MVQSLEQFVAQATRAYQPASNAIQSQLDALSGRLETANQAINKNYAQQQATLNRNRNAAAESASMQAAGSGGSFGGAANIANRKYYDQSFVPAVTQLQTNQANELAQARQNSENERTNLNSQLANLQSQAQQNALQRYWQEVEAERQREFEAAEAEKARQAQLRAARETAAASNSQAQYLMDAIRNASIDKSNTSFLDWLNKYSGLDNNTVQKWTKKVNSLTNSGASLGSAKGLANVAKQSLLNAALQASPEYKQYLSWRNS